MSAADRVRWDAIYRERFDKPYPAPDPLLFNYTPRVPHDSDNPLRALDLAGGVGQNALWLAAQGYAVDLVDISRIALQRARAEMASRNLRSVNLLQVDMEDFTLDPTRYDVVCVFRYLKREMFQQIRDAIRPGGRVIYETFNKNYLLQVPDFNSDFLLMTNELLSVFSDWAILHHDESTHVTQIVAMKPEHP